MVDHQAECILPLIDQIRTLHLAKDDLIFIRVKEATRPEDMKRISDTFNGAFPHNLVYVLDHRIDLSVVRPDSELAKRLGPYPTEHIDGQDA